MADSSRFDFCEKCGALSRDGQCQSCGYKDPRYIPPVSAVSDDTQKLEAPKSNAGIIALIVTAIVILSLFLTCGVGFIMLFLTTDITDKLTNSQYGYENYTGEEYSTDYDDSYNDEYNADYDEYYDEYGEQIYPEQDVEGLKSGKYYTNLYSDFKYDLSYSVEMTSGVFMPEEYENVVISVEYPVISGNVPNLPDINEMLEYEYNYYMDYFVESYEPDMEQDSYYIAYATCYITYMDEKVMSVVFQEEILLDDFSAINFYCLNFDMVNGVLLNNTEILDMDEDFVVDFRRRELLENGYESLPDYTDQEILELLQDEEHLVIFYTPMGMEVGLNLGDIVIYMTYSDYRKFLKQY